MSDTNAPTSPIGPQQPSGTPRPSFFSALFDVKFDSFVTPRVIPVFYVLGMIGIVIGYLSYVILAFNLSSAFGIVTLLILGPLGALLTLIFLRVTLEFYLALVRMSDEFHHWRTEWRSRD